MANPTTTSRPWQDESDYARLRLFLQHLPGMADEAGNCTIGDLDWWRYTHNNPDKMREVQLWLDDDGDTVIGYVWPEGNTFDAFIDPRHAHYLPEMIAWGEASARAKGDKEVEVIANDRDRAMLSQKDRAAIVDLLAQGLDFERTTPNNERRKRPVRSGVS